MKKISGGQTDQRSQNSHKTNTNTNADTNTKYKYRNSQVARLGGEWPRSADTRTVIRGRQGEGTKKPGPSIGPKCRVSNTKHKVTKLGNT